MKIAVCVKYVPDATSDRGFEADLTVDRVSVGGLLSELDEYAVEQALRIRELSGVDEVIALSIGPEGTEEAIAKSLQLGVDRAVHVMDDSIAGSDALATSRILAKALESLAPDLVVCGMASTDAGMSVVPAMLAERLSLPQLTFASVVEVVGRDVRITREDDTSTAVVEATMPLVLSVTDRSGEARYPSFKGIMAAKKKPVETLSLEDIGIDPADVGLSAAWTSVDDVAPRPPREQGRIVPDNGTGATELVAYLASKKFV